MVVAGLRCEFCGTDFEPIDRGRPRRFCDATCRNKARRRGVQEVIARSNREAIARAAADGALPTGPWDDVSLASRRREPSRTSVTAALELRNTARSNRERVARLRAEEVSRAAGGDAAPDWEYEPFDWPEKFDSMGVA